MLTSRTFAVNHTPPRRRTPETTLYAPVKRYLEALGFTVKGEVCGCDLVALRGEEPPIVVIGELKLAFSLELVLQGVDRTAACGEVWLAVRVAGRGGPSPARPTLSPPLSRLDGEQVPYAAMLKAQARAAPRTPIREMPCVPYHGLYGDA